MKNLSKQNGISLVELLVATTISLFLIASMYAIYLSNKKSYQYNESLAYIQENSRLAFLSLTHDIHAARAVSYIPATNTLQLELITPESVLKVNSQAIKINHLQTMQYFVANDKINKKSTSVLFRKDMDMPTYPSGLIDNVDSINFLFYTKKNPTHEYSPSEIHDWSQVVGVKIILVLSNENQSVHRTLNMVIAFRNPLS